MNKNTPIYVYDFETTSFNTKFWKENERVKTHYFYGENIDNPNDTFDGISIDTLFQQIWDRQKSVCIFYHNLSFDAEFIIDWYLRKVPNALQTLSNTPLKNKQVGIYFFKNGNKIFELQIGRWVRVGTKNMYVKIEFRCSLRLLSSPVEELGKTFKLHKYLEGENLEELYNQEPFEMSEIEGNPKIKRYVEYCVNDVKIVIAALRKFREQIEGLKIVKNKWSTWKAFDKLTAGSLSYTLCKSATKKFYESRGINNSASWFDGTKLDHLLGSEIYMGGLTQFTAKMELGKRYKVNNGITIDINSCYPYAMTMKMPLTHTKREVSQINDKEKYSYILRISASKVTPIYKDLYFLPKPDDFDDAEVDFSRYLNKWDTTYANTFTLEKLETLSKYYEFHNLQIETIYEFDAEPFLAPFVNWIYGFKEQAAKDNNKSEAFTWKIMLNALYGKFGTRDKFDREYHSFEHWNKNEVVSLADRKDRIKEYKVKYEKKTDQNRLHPDIYTYILLEEEEPSQYYNKIIAGFITSYAFSYLLENLYILGPDKFIYCDTDSLFLENPDLSLINIDPYKLGAWAVEDKFDEIWVKGAKVYMKKIKGEVVKGAYSGINKKYLTKNMNDKLYSNDTILECANLKRVRVPGGVLLTPTDYQPKSRSL